MASSSINSDFFIASSVLGGKGDDIIIGKSSIDIAVYQGISAEYNIVDLDDETVSVSSREPFDHIYEEGNDVLTGIEIISFVDKDILVSQIA